MMETSSTLTDSSGHEIEKQAMAVALHDLRNESSEEPTGTSSPLQSLDTDQLLSLPSIPPFCCPACHWVPFSRAAPSTALRRHFSRMHAADTDAVTQRKTIDEYIKSYEALQGRPCRVPLTVNTKQASQPSSRRRIHSRSISSRTSDAVATGDKPYLFRRPRRAQISMSPAAADTCDPATPTETGQSFSTDGNVKTARPRKKQKLNGDESAQPILSQIPLTPRSNCPNSVKRTPGSLISPSASYPRLKRSALPRLIEFVEERPIYKDELSSKGLINGVLQESTCVSGPLRTLTYATGQCKACQRRSWTSDGCGFKDIRKVVSRGMKSEGALQYVLVDEPLVEMHVPCYRPELSCLGSNADSRFVLQHIATSFRSILEAEQNHESRPHILRRGRDEGIRPMCDGCSTTIFSGHWLCYVCASELCLDCYAEWDDTSHDPQEIKKFLHLNKCRKVKGRPLQVHSKAQMVPYTRFRSKELAELLHAQEHYSVTILKSTHQVISSASVAEGLPYAEASVDAIDLSTFHEHWQIGQPLLLTGLRKRFKLDWTPDLFISRYGSESTELVDVTQTEVRSSTIDEFFSDLKTGKSDALKNLKLNDWPEVGDFAVALPDLFDDFEQALPFPIYTRRRGHLNLAAWFPPQFVPPDLGPKLYCAGASSDAPGAQGTTVLHLDMTDAVNIMTWAGPAPNNRPGCAVWDIFAQADADHLRRYIIDISKARNPGLVMDDPIRRAQFYLTTDDLARLAKECQVIPHRIYQNPGDAIFIPAGCAHQVCNLTPCIKVACDFVSPQNVHRCSSITMADRKLAPLAKREDVLQLKNIIYFAFLGVNDWLANSQAQTEEPSQSLTAPSQEHIDDSAASAYKKFIEQYGHGKLVELFVADCRNQTYLKQKFVPKKVNSRSKGKAKIREAKKSSASASQILIASDSDLAADCVNSSGCFGGSDEVIANVHANLDSTSSDWPGKAASPRAWADSLRKQGTIENEQQGLKNNHQSDGSLELAQAHIASS